jgi:hypothetical protein
MKKSNFIVILTATLIILAVIGSGCLDQKEPEQIEEKVSGVNSVRMLTDEENLIAMVYVVTYSTHDLSADKQNVSSNISENNVNIVVPMIKSEVKERDYYETISVDLGNKNQFKDGQRYDLIVNGKKADNYSFEFTDGTPYIYDSVNISEMKITTSGKDIVVKTRIDIGGFEHSIDKENITVSKKLDGENTYEIYIPRKSQIYPSGTAFFAIMTTGEEEIVIGQTNELPNGKYHVNVNGKSASFTIKYGLFIPNN